MKPASDGLWSVSVAFPAGTYQYRFLVDGEWRDDPECGQRAPNPYGGQNMVRVVPQVQKTVGTTDIPIARVGEYWPGWKPTNTATNTASPESSRPRIRTL